MREFGPLIEPTTPLDKTRFTELSSGDYRIGVITGVNGAGKTTTTRNINVHTAQVELIKRHTTKELRQNDYLYKHVPELTFIEMLDDNEFVEAALYGPGYYGTSVTETKKSLGNVSLAVCEMDPIASLRYKARLQKVANISVRLYFLNPYPDDAITDSQKLAYMNQRTRDRENEHPEEISRRLKSATFTYDHSRFDRVIPTHNDDSLSIAKQIYEDLSDERT